MSELINIGIIGDFNPNKPSHKGTNDSLNHAAKFLSIQVYTTWLATESFLNTKQPQVIQQFDGFWAAPGSPYQSLEGALEGIRLARESGLPFLGTCGGAQHALLEYARNILGIKNAVHLEYNSPSGTPFIIPISCPVSENQGALGLPIKLKIKLRPSSLVFKIYQRFDIEEAFNCNYGLNPKFIRALEKAGLRITGVNQDGDPRIAELRNHKFFLATTFQPQLTSEENHPHPLIVAYVKSAMEVRQISRKS